MDLNPYVESIRRDLASAADVAGDEARATADRLTAALEAGVRLALLDALSEASAEITRELAPGSVEVRLRAREPEFVVTPPPEPEEPDEFPGPPPPPPPTPPGVGEDRGTSRLTLRMPETLKAQVEAAAEAEGISVNQWLVRAVTDALAGPGVERGRRRRRGIGQQYTGWAR